MTILAMLVGGIGLAGFLYRRFYLPTQTEKDTALGVQMTEEGLESLETRRLVRHFRSLERGSLIGFGAVLLAAVMLSLFNREAGILLELFALMAVWQAVFYIYQKYYREMVWLKYRNQWLDDTAKHMCHVSDYIDRYRKTPVKDLAFVPLYLLPFLTFAYPGTKEYLQGNLWHGMLFLLPFVILLALQAVYYAGVLDRNLLFVLAGMEEMAYLLFQWKFLVEKTGFLAAFGMYLLLLLLAVFALLPWLRGILTDKELQEKKLPERIPSEGEELWLYGYYYNQKENAMWIKKKFGACYVPNHARIKAGVLLLSARILWYGGIAYYICQIGSR